MRKRVSVFIPYSGQDFTGKTVKELLLSPFVENVFLLVNSENVIGIPGCKTIVTDSLISTQTMKSIAASSGEGYSLFLIQDNQIEFGQFALERFAQVAENTGAGIVYSDYYEIKEGARSQHPVIDYQAGSVRDDFNFGYVYFFDSAALKKACEADGEDYKFAGLYDTRLKVS